MFIYLLRRLSRVLVSLFFLTILTYAISRLAVTNPEFDFWRGWVEYVGELLQGDLGQNRYGDISYQVYSLLPATVELSGYAFIFALFLGTIIGIVAGMNHMRLGDKGLSTAALVFFSAPTAWFAVLFIMFFASKFQWLPISGRHNLLFDIPYGIHFLVPNILFTDLPNKKAIFFDSCKHLMLPCFVLMIIPVTRVGYLMRYAIADVLKTNYIRSALINGLSNYEVVIVHALRNAIPPIMPKMGAQYATITSQIIIVEYIFNWPGLGNWLLHSLLQKDYMAVQAAVFVLTFLVLLVCSTVEVISIWFSPLIRKEWYERK